MMKTGVIIVLLGLCITMATGHLCLLSPPQRGSMIGLNKAGNIIFTFEEKCNWSPNNLYKYYSIPLTYPSKGGVK